MMVALNIIIAVFVCLLFVVLMCHQIHSNRRHAELVGFSTRYLPLILLHLAVMSLWALSSSENTILLLILNLFFGILPMLLLASAFLPKNLLIIGGFIALGEIFNLLNFLSVHLGWFMPGHTFYSVCTVTISFIPVIYMVVSLWLYIGKIRNLLQKTTVWTMLSLSADVVYVFFLVVIAVAKHLILVHFNSASPYLEIFFALVLLLFAVALIYRISSDSLFFIMREHERVILESLNETQGYMISGKTNPDELYRDIFARIVDHFERDMPFLSGNLVIEDLVKVVFANKLYISRAISRCAGRNFCQFVNYYRIRHSVEIFRQNPELKVAELACQCGFNSVGSFTMAFKLYMNENPSDWIRQERSRMIKYRQ